MDSNSYKYQRKELELKALLEITQAINENQSEEVLINIFKFTCLVHLEIKSLILYVAKEEDFEQRIVHGVKSKTPFFLSQKFIKEDKLTGNGTFTYTFMSQSYTDAFTYSVLDQKITLILDGTAEIFSVTKYEKDRMEMVDTEGDLWVLDPK